MDFQNREGGKTGTGGLLSASESNADRRERLKKLALETIDLSRDPYFLKNHLGSYECRLCLTLHVNEGSYLVHTQGKKHQANLGRRRAREANTSGPSTGISTVTAALPAQVNFNNNTFKGVKLGRPGYRIIKIRDPTTRYLGIRVQVHYPQPLSPDLPRPMTRLISAFEQRIEPPNKLYQYLVIAAPMYDSVSIKIPSKDVHENWDFWDEDTRLFTYEIIFKQ